MYSLVSKPHLTWRRHFRSPFREVQPDREKFLQDMTKTPQNTRFVVFFTPRSGSSRLTDILKNAPGINAPGEHLNPALIGNVVQKMNAENVSDYLGMLVRHKYGISRNFGIELTWKHKEELVPRDVDFLAHFGAAHYFWLLRHDIIAQAVSATRMVQTGEAHRLSKAQGHNNARQFRRKIAAQPANKTTSAQVDTNARPEFRPKFRYDPRRIRRHISMLRWMETRTERFFARHDITPTRLSYEQTTGLSPAEVVALFQNVPGCAPAANLEITTQHQKISDQRNAEYAARFRAEHPRLIARLDRARAPLLQRHP